MIELLLESALRALFLGLGVGAALAVLRVKNPHIKLTVWGMVLGAALVMPALMHLTIVSMTIPEPQAVPVFIAGLDLNVPPVSGAILAADLPGTPPFVAHAVPDWRMGMVALYLVVAATLLAKILIGIGGTVLIARRAHRLDVTWPAKCAVRVSDAISVPVTFGSTILLPAEFPTWDEETRQAALTHEYSHVQRGDFYLLLAAEIHRALFWFSPFAWWLRLCLADLAEAASDDAAIERIGDRSSYAEILLTLAGRVKSVPAGVPMARPVTIVKRIDRILREKVLAVRPSGRRLALVILSLVPLVVLSSRLVVDARAEQVALTMVDMKHYQSKDWGFELDIPKTWNHFPPVSSNSQYEVARFESDDENGHHNLIVFRSPYNPAQGVQASVDRNQKSAAKGGFTNFVQSETKIGSKEVVTLEKDMTNKDGKRWYTRQYYVVDGNLLYILGFGTTKPQIQFKTDDEIAKTFVTTE